ncbi:hypothetical protein FNV43_RR27036 [Rhamnella rubrinervis]|uniref:Uncharacterized protein n=1 Tax=Rhamnella rubrinervis TaxID=2594499 RepID=A0A8K0GPB0_9ROSA|nr:hypothetical protein FNV43_RR27036 [Rhamnella rubrinervis]
MDLGRWILALLQSVSNTHSPERVCGTSESVSVSISAANDDIAAVETAAITATAARLRLRPRPLLLLQALQLFLLLMLLTTVLVQQILVLVLDITPPPYEMESAEVFKAFKYPAAVVGQVRITNKAALGKVLDNVKKKMSTLVENVKDITLEYLAGQ